MRGLLTLLSLLVLLGSSTGAWAQTSGIFEGYVIVSANGGTNTYYDLNGTTQNTQTANPDFNGGNLGTFVFGETLTLRGAQLKTFKNSGDDVTGAQLQYRIYPGSSGTGSFTAINLPFDQNLPANGDQQWQQSAATVNLLAGLPSGTYTLEVYGEISTNSGARFYSDGGANYKATFTVSTQLLGTYTINNTLPTGARNFASFTAAINALNAQGVGGAVTFEVANSQTFTEIPPAITTSGSTGNLITFREATLSAGNLTDNPTIVVTGTAAATDAGITITGADYLVFDGINVAAATGSTTAEYGYLVRNTSDGANGAQNNTVRNARIVLNRANTASFGVMQTSSVTGGGASANTSNSTVSTNRFNKFHNLTIENSYGGIYLLTGNTGAQGYDDNTEVYNNIVGGTTAGDIGNGTNLTAGIRATRQNNLKVYGNTVRNVTVTSTSFSVYGIWIEGAYGPAQVYSNRISDIRIQGTSTSATGVVYGLRLDVDVAGTVTGHRITAYNNFVWNLLHNFTSTATATRRIIGIATQVGGTGANHFIDVLFNSVRIETPSTYTASSTAFESLTSGTGPVLTLRNNVFANFSAATTSTTPRRFAIVSSSASAFGNAGSTSDYNDLYAPNGMVGRGSSTDYATLTAWQNAYPGYGAGGANIDANSKNVDPLFTSATDLHLQTASPLRSAGVPVSAPVAVTTDIDGDPRKTLPDIGGDETPAAAVEVSLVAINGLTAPFAAGPVPVTLSVANTGTSALTSLTVSYTLNGTTTGPLVLDLSASPVAANSTGTVSLGSLTFLAGVNTLSVTISNPNGVADPSPANNTLSGSYTAGLSGQYTIDNTQATDINSRRFASFNDAATALINGGVLSAVTFNVLNGPYTERVVLTAIPGASATNTVTFNGNGRTLQYSTGTSALRAVVQLNGADYIIFDNLSINADVAGSTYGWAYHLTDGADFNTIRNSTITSSSTSTLSNYAGIVASGSATTATTAGNAANALTLQGNTIIGGFYGIILNGTSSTSLTTGHTIVNNEVRDFYLYGIDVESNDGPQIRGNNVHRTSRANVSTFYGIYLSAGVKNARVERNRVHSPFSGNTASTSTAYGLYISSADGVAGQENDFVNNLVYNFNGSGTEYGIYNSGSAFARYYFNSVSLDNQAATGATQLTYGFYQTLAATDIDFRNNVVSVTRTGGSGLKHALYHNTAGSAITSDYNDLYVGSGSLFFTGFDGTNSHATLADWRNATPHDDNSVQADPLFDTMAATPLTPTSGALDGRGTAISGITTDFAGTTRTSPPDMGAVEFTPAALDLGAVALVSPAPAGCYSATQPVVVRIQNLGGTAIDFSLNNATVSGSVSGAATQTFAPVTLSTGTLAANATRDVQIGTLDMTTAGTYTFEATAGVAGETNTSNNALATTSRTQNGTVTLTAQPTTVNFTGYTGANLSTVFPGWREAEGTTLPVGTASNWTSDAFANVSGGANGTAAKIALDAANEDGWIVSPRFAVTATTELSFDLALTASSATTATAFDADDVFEVRISTDCGVTYVPLRTFGAGTAISNTGQTETINLGAAYAGQEVILGFFATEGATGSTIVELFLDNITLRSPLADDAGVVAIIDPVMPFAPTTQTVSAQVQNSGSATLNSVTVNWTVNGVAQTPQTFTGLNLAPGATSGNLTLGTFDFSVPGPRFVVVATASQPNGNADQNAANDAFTRTVIPSLTGTFTINSALPTGGGNRNFVSFTDAAAALNTAGVAGAVTLNVDASSGPYTEQITLTTIAGASATNTITFNGNGRTLQFGSTTSAQRAVIKLDGADYVTLNNLNVVANPTGATYGWGIHLANEADHNQVLNSTITTDAASTSTSNFVGIVAVNSTSSLTATGNAANSTLIRGNTVVGGYRGIVLYGSTTTLNTGNIVENNQVREFYTDGIQLYGQSGAQVLGNEVSRPNRTAVSTFTGIAIEGSTRATTVARNRVHSPFSGNTASTSTAYGLYISSSDGVAGQENDFVNNLVYNFNGSGTEYGIYNSGSAFARYYFNSVSLDNPSATGATQSTYGFYQTTAATGIDFRNNVVSVTRTGGTGSKYAVYWSTTTSGITSNYNDLYVGSGSLYFTARFGSSSTTGINYATLADWKAAAPAQDANSIQGNPGFTSATNLMPNPADPNSYHLNGTGVQLALVNQDFAGNPRPTTVAAGAPDLGAYEFTPTAQPNVLTTTGTYALGGTQEFFFAGRRVASITYGTTGTLPTTLTARYYPGTNPRSPRSAARYMNSFLELVASNDGTGFTYDLTLHYDDALLGTVTPETALRLTRRDPVTGLNFFFESAVVDALANTLTQTGLTQFGEFTGSDQAAPLPVSLTAFEAKHDGANGLLTWTTAQEKNNRGFEVQVSSDGVHYRTLGFVASENPNAASPQSYRFLDREAGKQGRRYYRLRQLDLDGSEAFFGPRTLTFEATAQLGVAAFPTLFGEQLTVEVSSPAAATTEVQLLDAVGRVLLRQPAELTAGVQQLQLRGAAQLPTGTYVLRLTANGQTRTVRVVRQ
ncbi:hypothetical protein GCM10023186_44490 [Hymenobacter koreensis]|uniref:T9SS type A sorting domain-containing protein n=1 Tax=Hymenobacter koreensis TaxID=1084523 RepID=A0ABP8JN60_9BACT